MSASARMRLAVLAASLLGALLTFLLVILPALTALASTAHTLTVLQ
jgi:fumarate reductase subunit D